MEDKKIIVSPIVMPAVTKEEAIRAFNAYQELANAILRPEDIQKISGKEFKKKSFWRKCQRFFNLSTQIISEVRDISNGSFTYKFTVRATAPNGAYMDATGACSSNEKGLLKTEHNTRATAETRAKNRAIADLVAFGEVSAEEITGENENGHNEDRTPDFANSQNQQSPTMLKPAKTGYPITEKQQKLLFARCNAKGVDNEVFKEYLRSTFKIESTKDISSDWMDDILSWIDGWGEKN